MNSIHTPNCPFHHLDGPCVCLRESAERSQALREDPLALRPELRAKLVLFDHLRTLPLEVVMRAVADLIGAHIETLSFPWDEWFEIQEALERLSDDPHQRTKGAE